jgi:hypothetical protein
VLVAAWLFVAFEGFDGVFCAAFAFFAQFDVMCVSPGAVCVHETIPVLLLMLAGADGFVAPGFVCAATGAVESASAAIAASNIEVRMASLPCIQEQDASERSSVPRRGTFSFLAILRLRTP